jgi:hypothetical protein
MARAATPAGATLEQLRSRGADHEHGNSAGPVDEMLNEIEQIVIRPMQILEDEHQRALLGEPLEVAPPRREGLVPPVAANCRIAAEPGERTQMPLDPLRVRRLGDELGDRGLQLLRDLLR